MMITARRRIFAAHLGLLAFVLIVLAPLASQLRAEPADWRWLNELACHEGGDPEQLARDGGRPVLQVDACGYCSLFSHCPALADSHWAVALRQSSSRQTGGALALAPLSCTHFPRALSRAPPMHA
ncbi:DUF2946 domain-containing protein [Pseudomonas sp. NCCP-436]|uniref:DUF2946 domain-containing protein n=1 Tax=Pseudomonas sp. NCCP-436 TaxID=2842481 RepID=UPI001C7F6061|nr:DUF2946 domain-containing protein [Pseudomonas sp. NCCP-436]GIZ12263.1 hypothetical protein NCCP436_16790 [Pseudomonas sp. NCCP-436]